jgi:hypothetical protein
MPTRAALFLRARRPAFAAIACSFALTLLAPHAVRGQDSTTGSSSNELGDWGTYQLTQSNLTKFIHALRNLVPVYRKHPELLQTEGVEGDPDESACHMAARTYDSQPSMKRAITNAGLSTYEYACIWGALTMAMSLKERLSETPEGQIPDSSIASNLRFMNAHPGEMAQFDSLQNETMKLQPARRGH